MRAAAAHPDGLRLYRALERRNRIVGVLRWAVPLVGVGAFGFLVVQIVLAQILGQFEIGRIAIAPDAVTIDGPEYAGVLEDGSLYRVRADSATSRFASPDMIDLTNGTVHIERSNGVTMEITAPEARLDTAREIIHIEGIAEVADSTGTSGILYNSEFDWNAQVLVSEGPVEIDYADGTRLDAGGLVYEAATAMWTFSGVKVILPDTPGAESAP